MIWPVGSLLEEKRVMTALGGSWTFTPTSIHRAIDQATSLKIELQRLRLQVRAGATVDEERLQAMEQIVDQLAVALIECRDQDRQTG
jgi:hypothetical protein